MSPLTADAKAKLKQDLTASITDPIELSVVTSRLDPILRDDPPNWINGDTDWRDYINKAEEREPSTNELAQFHADLACVDTEGFIADSMARRVEDGRRPYAKPFATRFSMRIVKAGRR